MTGIREGPYAQERFTLELAVRLMGAAKECFLFCLISFRGFGVEFRLYGNQIQSCGSLSEATGSVSEAPGCGFPKEDSATF